MKNLFLFTLLLIHVMAFSQDLKTTIPSKDGRVFIIPPGPNYVIDDAHLDTVYVEIMGTDTKPAHAIIQDGTEETNIYAKTIYIQPNLDNFRLTGNARILQGESVLKGPKRIEFTSNNNTMVLEGTEEIPAGYEYKTGSGIPVISDGQEIHLIFIEEEGKRILKTVKMVRGHQGSRILPRAQVNDKTIMRKTSPLN